MGAGASMSYPHVGPHTDLPDASSSSSSSSSCSSWAQRLSSLAEGGGGSSSVQLMAGGFTACPSFFLLVPVGRKDAGGGCGEGAMPPAPMCPATHPTTLLRGSCGAGTSINWG